MSARFFCRCSIAGVLTLAVSVGLFSGALSCDRNGTTDLTETLQQATSPAPDQSGFDVLALVCPAPPAGTAPVSPPTGGFGIDGDLRANAPTVGIGDWIPGAAGAGGSVLTSAGCSSTPNTTLHLTDPANSASDDNFSGGFKADQNPNVWQWTKNPVNGKQDLKHAFIHNSRNTANGHAWIVIGATRESNNGDSYIDFEFLQNSIALTNAGGASGGFTSAGPQGGRTLNDFILTLNFTKGGSTAGLCVQRWKQIPGSNPAAYDYFDDTANLPANAVFAAVNSANISIPNCPSGSLDTYPNNSFAEAAVDLSALVGDFDPCLTIGVKNVFVKTKESQSPTANIVDFIAPIPVNLVLGPSASAGDDQAKCSGGSSTTFSLHGTATAGTHPIASMTWTPQSANVTIDAPTSCNNCMVLDATAHVTGTPATATVRLTVIDSFNCTKTDDVVLTVNNCTGACCLACPAPHQDSFLNTCVVVTAASCAAQGGHFNGIGTPCDHPTCGDCPVSSCQVVCPDPKTVNCGDSTEPSATGTAQCISTNCVTGCDLSHSDVFTPGCHGTGTITRTWTCRCLDSGSRPASSCDQIITIVDNSAPTFTCPTGSNLGCNPTTFPTCDSVKALVTDLHDNCDPNPTLHCDDGGVQVNGCQRSETFALTASDDCGNSTPATGCRVTYNWTVVTRPSFANCGQTVDLGCNPANLPTCDNYADFGSLGVITVSNECGALTPSCSSANTDNPDGCHHSRTLTFTATACGLTSTCTRTYNWTRVTAPVFANCGQTVDLGCNPSSLPTCDTYADFGDSLGLVTASNECGSVTPTCSSSDVDDSDGCHHTRTLTFTATACGLTNTCTRTFNWTRVTAPVFANCGQTVELGCNPASLPTCDTYQSFGDNGGLGPVTASNECGPVNVTCCQNPGDTDPAVCNSTGDHVGNCMRMRTLRFKATSCGLTSTCTRTYVWRQD